MRARDDEAAIEAAARRLDQQSVERRLPVRTVGAEIGKVPALRQVERPVTLGIDMIRCAKPAKDRDVGGPILPASAWFSKHLPVMTDDEAHIAVEKFIRGELIPH